MSHGGINPLTHDEQLVANVRAYLEKVVCVAVAMVAIGEILDAGFG